MSEEPPLPYGWIKEFDENYQQYFYVDTKADPPRSIWIHPYKDEQFLREHPGIREKIGSNFQTPPGPPPFESRTSSYADQGAASSSNIPAGLAGSSGPEKRGLFGKLLGKTVGTKEEREAARRAEEEQQRRILEERRRRMEEQQRAYPGQYPQQRFGGFGGGLGAGGYGGGGYGGGGYGGAPPAGYIPQQQQGYYPPQQQQQPARRSGMGGMALPLVGGLAGGLLLGEALDGFGGDGGDGGDFGGDGGDFGGDGGGDFGGGDF